MDKITKSYVLFCSLFLNVDDDVPQLKLLEHEVLLLCSSNHFVMYPLTSALVDESQVCGALIPYIQDCYK